jgi:RNA-directed DNA polymerase
MTVQELSAYLREHWPRIREELLHGTYIPAPVRRVEIPKPDGKGVRPLGIPTVLDRFIEQAILQILTPSSIHTSAIIAMVFAPTAGVTVQ